MQIHLPEHLEKRQNWLRSIYPTSLFYDHLIDWGNILFNNQPEFTKDWDYMDQELAQLQYFAALEYMYGFERAISVEYNY
jgi:hypothetical protein